MDGHSKVIYGTLCLILADNLGSLVLGGFKESCSAFRCCRHCMATQNTARSVVHRGQLSIHTLIPTILFSSLNLGLY